jgi:hypothetical protein
VWPTPKNCASTCDIYNAGATGVCFASTKFKELNFMGELKIESVGYKGDGTYCSHWSEEQLGDELMTGKQTHIVSNGFFNFHKCNRSHLKLCLRVYVRE